MKMAGSSGGITLQSISKNQQNEVKKQND